MVDVDIKSVDTALDEIHDAIQDHIYDHSYNLIIHLGADASASRICIEKQAKNCNDFFIPDIEGNQPQKEKIDRSKGLDHCIQTRIDVELLCHALREKEHNCIDSTDAGNYICNYTYYQSMKLFDYIENSNVIFIHVPAFQTIKKEKQLACISEFIKKWIKTHNN